METPSDLRQHGGAAAYLQKCASQQVLEIIGSKWVTLVVGALRRDGSVRFSDLRRQLDGITQKMLTRTLRDLERNGFVSRTVFPTIPPRVEYRLTELGDSANWLIDAIRDWSEANIDHIHRARDRYDETESG